MGGENRLIRLAKWWLGVGILVGTVCMLLFDPLGYSILLGVAAAVLAAKNRNWKEGARIGAVTGVVLAVIYVVLFQFSRIDGGRFLDFGFIDHLLFLLILGGAGSALLGAVMGAVTSRIYLFFHYIS